MILEDRVQWHKVLFVSILLLPFHSVCCSYGEIVVVLVVVVGWGKDGWGKDGGRVGMFFSNLHYRTAVVVVVVVVVVVAAVAAAVGVSNGMYLRQRKIALNNWIHYRGCVVAADYRSRMDVAHTAAVADIDSDAAVALVDTVADAPVAVSMDGVGYEAIVEFRHDLE